MKNLTFKTTKALLKLVDQHDFRRYLTYVYYSKKSDSVMLSDGHLLIVLTENKELDFSSCDFSDMQPLDKDVLNKLVYHKQELNILDVLENHKVEGVNCPPLHTLFNNDFKDKTKILNVQFRVSLEYLKNIFTLVESLKEPQERKELFSLHYLGTVQNKNYFEFKTNNYLVFACIANIITN